MADEIFPYLEALKLVKEWSTTLLVVQTGVLTLIGALIQKKTVKLGRMWLIASLIFFTCSILFALHVIGAIPRLTQQLSSFVTQYGDIYQFRNYLGIPLWVLTTGQHIFFVVALICVMIYLYLTLKG